MCSTIAPRNPPRNTSLKTTFRLLFKKTRSGEDHRTPIGSRSRWGHRGDVRDTGQISLDRPTNGKLTSSSLATRYGATGSAIRISTAKPTVCTAGCELVLHNGNFLGVAASVSWRPASYVMVFVFHFGECL